MEQRHLPPLATALPQNSGGFYVVSGSSLNYTNGLEAFSFVAQEDVFLQKACYTHRESQIIRQKAKRVQV
jgi:hypothetical protein